MVYVHSVLGHVAVHAGWSHHYYRQGAQMSPTTPKDLVRLHCDSVYHTHISPDSCAVDVLFYNTTWHILMMLKVVGPRWLQNGQAGSAPGRYNPLTGDKPKICAVVSSARPEAQWNISIYIGRHSIGPHAAVLHF